MKNIKRLAAALRAAGIVLLALALVATFYSQASGGATWTPMRDKLVSVGADAGFGSRLKFDVKVYAAMSEAAANKDKGSAQLPWNRILPTLPKRARRLKRSGARPSRRM